MYIGFLRRELCTLDFLSILPSTTNKHTHPCQKSQEKVDLGTHTGGAGIGARYSSLSHEPRTEWQLEPGKPCSGERMLLMFDRWRKLLKSFYSEKKGTFDISKVCVCVCVCVCV